MVFLREEKVEIVLYWYAERKYVARISTPQRVRRWVVTYPDANSLPGANHFQTTGTVLNMGRQTSIDQKS